MLKQPDRPITVPQTSALSSQSSISSTAFQDEEEQNSYGAYYEHLPTNGPVQTGIEEVANTTADVIEAFETTIAIASGGDPFLASLPSVLGETTRLLGQGLSGTVGFVIDNHTAISNNLTTLFNQMNTPQYWTIGAGDMDGL